MSSSSCGVRPPASSKVVVLLFIMTAGRLRTVMGIAIRAAARPRLVAVGIHLPQEATTPWAFCQLTGGRQT
jgi:hypothetical protein